ncbi:family 20 glycosylhydrolase [Flavihumibacter sp. R14]|nr:family 20 glycosylhydrolase [Flavihumibacter soli]
MRVHLTCLILALIFILPAGVIAQSNPSIIPQPVNYQSKPGSFTINSETRLRYKHSDRDLKKLAGFFKSYVEGVSGYELRSGAGKPNVIELKLSNTDGLGDEGYKLSVSPEKIILEANKTAGIFYGMQSVFQTLPQVRTNAALEVPAMEVFDFPRFKYRGMHLDVSRHFFSADLVKEYIDLISQYKMNTFHWHLVDDQGWRIEIKKYPELTKTGAWRVDQNQLAWSDRPQARQGEKAAYGGYYTQEQIKDIIRYAALRQVTIIPEIEMPGHVASAIASYPNLSCVQNAQLPLTGGNYSGMSSNYCAGNEEVFTFLEGVLDEVTALFPSKYIHIGGDEVDKSPWKRCARCQARIKAEGLSNEEELQSYFIRRIEKYLTGKGRKIIGWDEILEGGLAPDATVMSWRGEAGGVAAAKMKHDVVMTPGNPVYFDHYQGGPEGEPLAIGGFNTLKKVYNYEPIPKELSAEEAKYVLGAQANLWTEYITTAEHVEYMILPRMPALAEAVWSQKESRNWDDFNHRLQYHLKAYSQKGLHYSPGNFTVDIKPVSENGKLTVVLATEILNGQVYYTLDGSEPTPQSLKYQGPVNIDSTSIVKAATLLNGRVMGIKPAQQSFVVHKGIGKNVLYANQISSYYQADGPNSLTDGVKGTSAVGKFWHGISEKDLVATVDLGAETEVKQISLGCLQNYGDWILLPSEVKFETSADGKNFREVKTMINMIPQAQRSAIQNFVADFPPQTARYIRVSAKNGMLPAGHSGAGKPAWIFADEISVN